MDSGARGSRSRRRLARSYTLGAQICLGGKASRTTPQEARQPLTRCLLLLLACVAQTSRCLFGSNVALRCTQKFVAHHEFPHHRRTQQRRIEMRVKMPLGMSFAVGGTLVKSHGIGKRSLEQVIVTRRDTMQDVR